MLVYIVVEMIFYFSIDTAKDIRWFTSLFCFCKHFYRGSPFVFCIRLGSFCRFYHQRSKRRPLVCNPFGLLHWFCNNGLSFESIVAVWIFYNTICTTETRDRCFDWNSCFARHSCFGRDFSFFERHSFCAVAFCFAE